MDPGIIATLVTGGLGVAAIIASKFKCLCHCTGCFKCESCKFGFLDNAIVDTHEVEFKKIQANGNDLIYVSKKSVNVNDSDDEISNKTAVPSEFLQVEEHAICKLIKHHNIFILVMYDMSFLMFF